MLVSDIMTTNVVSIPSHTSLAEARRIMKAHSIRRLPVIDRGKLVGIVTKDSLDRMGPSQMTTFSIHELSYLVNEIKVKEVMQRDVATVTPAMTVEGAVSLAQNKKVGALVVTEGEMVVGIATTNDVFFKVLNPILGIGVRGSRIVVRGCCQGSDIEKIIAFINKLGVGIITLFTTDFPEVGKRDLVVHLDMEDNAQVIEGLQKLGYAVEGRAR